MHKPTESIKGKTQMQKMESSFTAIITITPAAID